MPAVRPPRALRSRTGLDDASRFELLLRYVRATNFAGGLEEARLAGEEAVELARRELGPAAHGRALTVLAWALWSLDRVLEAKVAAETAVTLLAAGDVGELARAWSADLRMEAVAFDAGAVVASAPLALDLAQQARLEDVRVDIAISVGLARGHRGEAAAQDQLADALARAPKAAPLPDDPRLRQCNRRRRRLSRPRHGRHAGPRGA